MDPHGDPVKDVGIHGIKGNEGNPWKPMEPRRINGINKNLWKDMECKGIHEKPWSDIEIHWKTLRSAVHVRVGKSGRQRGECTCVYK